MNLVTPTETEQHTDETSQQHASRKVGVIAKDDQGRVIKYRTRRGSLIYRIPETRDGQTVFRDQFTYRVKVQGKQFYFNLASEKEAAAKLADDISKFLSVSTNTIQQAIERFSPDKVKRAADPRYPTVGELIQTFGQVANTLTDRSKREYTGALRRVAGYVQGLKPFCGGSSKAKLAAWHEEVDKLNVSLVTPERLESLRGSVIKAAGKDEIKKGKAVVTANAIIRNAGCIFAPKMRRLYTSFILPEPCPFKTVGQLEERPHRYVSKVDIAALVESARRDLAEKSPAEYVVFVLSLFGGLRRGEIDRLIWDQVDFDNQHIWIKTTPHFRPKARNSESRVDCPEAVFEVLRKFKPSSITPPFVVPGAGPEQKLRCRVTFQSLHGWLRTKGIAETKALHLLRKEAGSYIFNVSGSADKAAEFLRNDPRTAREYYLGRKDRLEVQIGGLVA